LKLLLFLLLCLVTLLFLRRWGTPRRRPVSPQEPAPPAAAPEEIVDVSFQECDAPEPASKRES
jgi:hypothetical protein